MLHEIKGRAAFIFIFYFSYRERGAAEKFFFYFLHEIKGAAALEKGVAAETFYFLFWVIYRGAGASRTVMGAICDHLCHFKDGKQS